MKNQSSRWPLFLIFSLAGVFLVLGYLTYKNTLTALGVWNNSSSLQIFLKTDIADADKQKLLAALKNQPSVTNVKLISPQQAAQAFHSSVQNYAQTFLNDEEISDLLPETVEVQLDSGLSIDQRQPIYAALAEKFKGANGVDEILDSSTWLQKFERIDRFVRTAGLSAFIFILFLLSYMVGLMLKVYIDESQSEIEVYLLLGSTRWHLYKVYLTDVIKILIGGLALTFAISLILFKLLKNYLAQSGLDAQLVSHLSFLNTSEIFVFTLALLFCTLVYAFYTVQESLKLFNRLGND